MPQTSPILRQVEATGRRETKEVRKGNVLDDGLGREPELQPRQGTDRKCPVYPASEASSTSLAS